MLEKAQGSLSRVCHLVSRQQRDIFVFWKANVIGIVHCCAGTALGFDANGEWSQSPPFDACYTLSKADPLNRGQPSFDEACIDRFRLKD